MTKDAPQPVADFYAQYKNILSVRKAELAETEERRSMIGEIFAKGTNLANEFTHHVDELLKGFGGSDISAFTHPSTLQVGEEKVNFVIQAKAWFQEHGIPKLPLEKYESVSIYPANNEGGLDHDANPLFMITKEKKLFTPAGQDDRPLTIQIVSDLMNTIEDDLRENHTPRSQMPQPIRTIKVRNPLSRILQRQKLY